MLIVSYSRCKIILKLSHDISTMVILEEYAMVTLSTMNQTLIFNTTPVCQSRIEVLFSAFIIIY